MSLKTRQIFVDISWRKWKRLLCCSVSVALLIVIALPFSVEAETTRLGSVKQATGKRYPIKWSSGKLTISVPAGKDVDKEITFTSSRKLKHVALHVSPSLRGYVKIRPSRFAQINAKTPYTVTFNITGTRFISRGSIWGSSGLRPCSRPLKLTFKYSSKNPLGGDNSWDYGSPDLLPFPSRSDCETCISFGIIADTHVNAHSCSDPGSNIHENRGEVYGLNRYCKGCLGIVHVGDMVNWIDQNDVVQQLIAFRQMWESDYPGSNGGAIMGCSDDSYNVYSNGYRTKFPVFPGVGNHDVRHCSESWERVPEYIDNRINGARGIIDRYGRVVYGWRSGRYLFLQLGLWAGSGENGLECEDHTQTDNQKLNWLRDFLKHQVGNSGLGVLIFQHYGWDKWTTNDTDPVWWTDSQRLKELNVLCRRDINNTDPDAPCDPYNILGIFTGHAHSPQQFLNVYAGTVDGGDFFFKNFVLRTSGVHDSVQRGFSVVSLDGQTMTIRSENRATGKWTTYVQNIVTPAIKGWSSIEEGPVVGAESAGGGAAIADIDGNGRPDLVLMDLDSPDGPNQFKYVVGWNLDGETGNPTTGPGCTTTPCWSPVKIGPQVGQKSAGGGAAIADIDGNGRPDLLLMDIDSPDGPNEFRYVVGWNLDEETGSPTTGPDCTTAPCWSPVKIGPQVGQKSAGGGAAIADIDGNGRPELVLMDIDSPDQANEFWYAIGWNLDGSGNPTTGPGCSAAPCWSPIKKGPQVGRVSAGGGAAIADINGNGRPELVLMDIDDPDQANQFWYVVGWDMDDNGDILSENWSSIKHGPCVGDESAGGGAAIADINGNGKPELVLMAIDNPGGANQFQPVVGWDLDANGDVSAHSSEVRYRPPGAHGRDGSGAALARIDGNGEASLVLKAAQEKGFAFDPGSAGLTGDLFSELFGRYASSIPSKPFALSPRITPWAQPTGATFVR